jgi:hypothetical protein
LVAARFEQALHLHTDDFYAWIVRGYVEPWRPESLHQNIVVTEAIAATADRFANGGYAVVVDGVLGPWFLDPWRALGRPVSYALLLPSAATARQRATDRGEHPLQDLDVVEQMHAAFVAHVDGLEHHVVDSTRWDPERTAQEVHRRSTAGELKLR